MKEHCDSIGRSVHVVNLGEQAPLPFRYFLRIGAGLEAGREE